MFIIELRKFSFWFASHDTGIIAMGMKYIC